MNRTDTVNYCNRPQPDNFFQKHGRYLIGIAIGIGVMCIALLCGCATTSTVTVAADGTAITNTVTTLDITKATNGINAVVPLLVRASVNKFPQAREYLQDAATAILFFTSTSTTFDPTALNAAIDSATTGDAVDADTLTAIDAGVALYKAYYGDALTAKLNTPAWLLPVLNSLANSINAGLKPAI